MRVGIVTQPFGRNYGGIIQNWALQKALILLGHSPVTLEHDTCYSKLRWLVRSFRHLLSKEVSHSIEKPVRGRICPPQFSDFIDKNIISTKSTKLKPISFLRMNCDAWITGSDQVWRPAFNHGCLHEMFLKHVPDSCPKIAYAASFGTSKNEFDEQDIETCGYLARRFKVISVREQSAVDFCKNRFRASAVQMPDPTLLIDKSHYLELCKHLPVSSPHIFVYQLSKSKNFEDLIHHVSSVSNLSVKRYMGGDGIEAGDSIEGWLASFRDAAYVVTDSFHGTIFSLLFNKPFAISTNHGGGEDRYHALLGPLQMEEKIDKICFDVIQWRSVNQWLYAERQRGLTFLNETLSCL